MTVCVCVCQRAEVVSQKKKVRERASARVCVSAVGRAVCALCQNIKVLVGDVPDTFRLISGKAMSREEKKAERQRELDKFWSKPRRATTVPEPAAPVTEGPVTPTGKHSARTVSEVLDLFFPPALIDMLVRESTIYAAVHHVATHFTAEDIYNYLTIIIYMGVQHNNSKDEMFSSDNRFNTGFCGSTMSRNRFTQVKRCLSVANPDAATNADDKLAKVRPFLDLVRSISQSLYRPSKWLSLDETSLQCAHRNARVAYRAQSHKKRRDFIKIICVNEARTAYCFDFLVDERGGQPIHNLVMKVLSKLPPDGVFTVATDRFYTSIKTAEALLPKGIYMYGTLRSNGGAHSELLKTFPENFVKGFFSERLSVWGWRDSGDVLFLSSFHGDEPDEVKRRVKGKAEKVTRPAPPVAVDYNRNMGGGDQFNSLMEGHSCAQVHQRRWYMALVYYGFDQLLINANVYFNNLPDTEALDSKSFRKAAIEHFLLKRQPSRVMSPGPESRSARPRLSESPSSTTIDYYDRLRFSTQPHIAEVMPDNRLRCIVCKVQTTVKCTACSVPLCLRARPKQQCFADFHSVRYRFETPSDSNY